MCSDELALSNSYTLETGSVGGVHLADVYIVVVALLKFDRC